MKFVISLLVWILASMCSFTIVEGTIKNDSLLYIPAMILLCTVVYGGATIFNRSK